MGGILSKKSGWKGDIRYLEAEFAVMDTDDDGLLSTTEFTNLLMGLGFGGDHGQTEALLKIMHKGEDDTISSEEYLDILKDNDDVLVKTSRLRVIFGNFDDANEGSVPKSKIEQRLKVMGFDVDDKMKKAIDDTDVNKDGNINYAEFLGKHLRENGFISLESGVSHCKDMIER